jgi:enoyl-CoA hydratase
MSEYGDQIDVTLDNDVLTIEIDRIDASSHIGLPMALRDAHQSEAKFVVITGKDHKFLSPESYDHEWIKTINTHAKVEQILRESEDTLRHSISLDKPTIAKVWAPGAHQLGASIALSCDFIIAADDATFSDPHLSGFGLPPGDGGFVLWPNRIGMTRAKEFLMLDRVATAQEAVEIGLINKAVPAEDLDAEVDKLLAKLRSFDYSSLRLTKHVLNNYAKQDMLTVGHAGIAWETMRFVSKVSGGASGGE